MLPFPKFLPMSSAGGSASPELPPACISSPRPTSPTPHMHPLTVPLAHTHQSQTPLMLTPSLCGGQFQAWGRPIPPSRLPTPSVSWPHPIPTAWRNGPPLGSSWAPDHVQARLLQPQSPASALGLPSVSPPHLHCPACPVSSLCLTHNCPPCLL